MTTSAANADNRSMDAVSVRLPLSEAEAIEVLSILLQQTITERRDIVRRQLVEGVMRRLNMAMVAK
jgi:hypothetical protein